MESEIITPEQITHLDKIFDRSKKIESDADFETLIKLVEDESQPAGLTNYS